ncbi:hypothetical protein FQA47_009412 [Oryzias melastigma]|uniref:Uncharacterized protein n=1 Tax=Oryzias melastigma TaxID=30732 RepID=A0A834CCY3_ORYME|nr:hypothetical protein FQA47_009412 [Oryzias melastigma]
MAKVCHFQLPVTAHCDSPPDLHMCLPQSAGSQPARQKQDRTSWNFLEMCQNRGAEESLGGLLLHHHGFQYTVSSVAKDPKTTNYRATFEEMDKR